MKTAKVETDTPSAAELSAIVVADHNRLTIERALKSASSLAEDIVVVDTRPRDGLARAAASTYGAKVLGARASSNRALLFRAALEQCQGEWVFWIESDEWLAPLSVSQIRKALPAPGVDAFSVWVRNCSTPPQPQEGFMRRACRLVRKSWALELDDKAFLASIPPGTQGCVRALDRVGLLHDGYAQSPEPSGEFHRNVKRLKSALASYPKDAELLYELGLEYYGSGDLSGAEEYLSLAADYVELPSSLACAIYALLIVCQRELGAPEVGAAMADNARRLGMASPELSFAEGWCQMGLGDFPPAAAAFAEARDLARSPSRDPFGCDPGIAGYRASMGLALALLENGDLDEATPHAREALANASDQPEPYVLLACLEHLKGGVQEAVELLQEALRLHPYHIDALTLSISVFTDADRTRDALQMANRLLEVQPDCAQSHIRRGFLLLELNRPEEALEEAEKAVSSEPESGDIQMEAGRLRAACADVRGALKCFERAISSNPAWAEPYFGAGDALYRAGAYEDAAHLYSLALELDPNNAAGFFAAGNACVRSGRLELAIQNWERALALEPDFPEAANNLEIARQTISRVA
ncbi:MAG: tetratricopeptide repeat protein [Armatimonadetes bacterium]|nr:tetratricopeptide repeat protein [Armatimonadota bacterium]